MTSTWCCRFKMLGAHAVKKRQVQCRHRRVPTSCMKICGMWATELRQTFHEEFQQIDISEVLARRDCCSLHLGTWDIYHGNCIPENARGFKHAPRARCCSTREEAIGNHLDSDYIQSYLMFATHVCGVYAQWKSDIGRLDCCTPFGQCCRVSWKAQMEDNFLCLTSVVHWLGGAFKKVVTKVRSEVVKCK